jgi:putative transposase
MHRALYVKCREQVWREASPTVAIVDAQSVKSAEKDGAHIDPHGYDAGKKIKGKKLHVLVDTRGLMLHSIVTAAEPRCWAHCSVCIRSCRNFTPMAATRDRNSVPP